MAARLDDIVLSSVADWFQFQVDIVLADIFRAKGIDPYFAFPAFSREGPGLLCKFRSKVTETLSIVASWAAEVSCDVAERTGRRVTPDLRREINTRATGAMAGYLSSTIVAVWKGAPDIEALNALDLRLSEVVDQLKGKRERFFEALLGAYKITGDIDSAECAAFQWLRDTLW